MISDRITPFVRGLPQTLILTGAFLLFAFLIKRWQKWLETACTRLAKEYRIDLDLAKRREGHLKAYQAVLANAKMPSGRPLRQNEWVQYTQKLASGGSLALRELKPVYRHGKKGEQGNDMLLVLEGPVTDIVGLLHQVAQSDERVYVDRLSLSRSDENTEAVTAQMTLSQVQSG